MNEITNILPIESPTHLSNDGFIRVHKSNVQTLRLTHFYSNLSENPINIKFKNDIKCEVSGYTEWIQNTTPAISIGWDWKLQYINTPPSLVMVGLPYSNIMLQNDDNKDLKSTEILNILSTVINDLKWKEKVMGVITNKYS